MDVATKYMNEVPREVQERAGKIRTFTGKLVDPLRMRPEDIDIRDIAHHLSNICRYTGAVRKFYSVAQHSVLVSEYLIDPELKLAGLLHDAAEAYLNDVSSPLKHAPEFRFYRETEAKLEALIFGVFCLDPKLMEAVKPFDDLVFQREVASFWGGRVSREEFIYPRSPQVACQEFRMAFLRLRPNWDGFSSGTIAPEEDRRFGQPHFGHEGY